MPPFAKGHTYELPDVDKLLYAMEAHHFLSLEQLGRLAAQRLPPCYCKETGIPTTLLGVRHSHESTLAHLVLDSAQSWKSTEFANVWFPEVGRAAASLLSHTTEGLSRQGRTSPAWSSRRPARKRREALHSGLDV